ncbi:hypothetical protein [Thiohalocapsa sp.]|uniref:hypothetical protein n=1 Tax=Thiohalocapsa sp. TaxID=2497641 RepID=UPI0025F691D9|nr:hypothetical protein [Thiohalocapsa sp.]
MTGLHRILAVIAGVVTLAACTAPEQQVDVAPADARGTLSVAQGGAGAVLLVVDGDDGTRCRWELKARYPANTAPHTVDMRAEYIDTTTGRLLAQSGTAETFPRSDAGGDPSHDGMLETSLFLWDEPLRCGRIEARINILACLDGNCPQYVAGTGAVPMRIVVTQN